MSGCARFILVNYKQDLLGKNTADNIGTFVLKGNELVSFEDKRVIYWRMEKPSKTHPAGVIQVRL